MTLPCCGPPSPGASEITNSGNDDMASWPRGSKSRLRNTGWTARSQIVRASRELRSRGHQLAVVVEDHGGAVEDELVLAADEVDVREGARCVGGTRGEHALALGEDAGPVRRRVDRHDELGAPVPQTTDRPERAPCVLTDRDADADAPDREETVAVAPGNEVAPLVEDAVVRKQLLADDGAHFPACAHGGGVVEIAVLFHEADDGRAMARRRRDLLEGEEVALDKTRLEQEVFGG